ncbi:general negative regulator of transcription subunit 5 [Tulasnella sp. 418]|nr:general negative regulator of transcription subunit 5 [Tulasnella sp. 418]
MAARKLQSEIDRTLKRVSEGVELFESIHDKMQTATNQTQKEKLESDLKTQIKKLQRLRDQIKTWITGSEIKDKSVLVDNRKLIETQMEKFKACEKEMKTKAFSKEGLTQAHRQDPKEKEKYEMQTWLSSMLEELARQVEHTEAEMAGLSAAVKKKNKAGTASKVDELSKLNARRNWHISRLEIVMRLLENGTLSTEAVGDLKEGVSYFVESNMDEDFEEYEGIYDDLNLDEEEEAFGKVGDDNNENSGDEQSMTSDVPPRTKELTKGKSPSQDDEPHVSPVLKKQPLVTRKQTLDKSEPPTLSTTSSKPPPIPTANFAAQPMAQALKSGLTPSTPTGPVKPVFPPMKYSAAAGGSSVPSLTPITSSATVATTTASSSLPPPTPASTAPSLPAATHSSPPQSPSIAASVSSPVASSIAPPSQASRVTPPVAESTGSVAGSYYHDSRQQSPALATTDAASVASPTPQSVPEVKSPAIAASTAIESTQSLNGVMKSQANAPSQPQPIAPSTTSGTAPQPQNPSLIAPPNLGPPSNPSPLPQQVQQAPIATPFPPGIQPPRTGTPTELPSSNAPPAQQSQRHTPAPRTSLPGSLGDLVSSFEAVKQKAAQRMNNPDQMHKVLENAMSGVPTPRDAEKPKYYVPRSQYNSPPYYPQTVNPFHSSPTLFAQLDVETLFYVFYFLPGTYQQYLAANELKKQSWRFHVKYLTWFQRHSEPQAITDEYEQGVYVYFDWEGSWCQRKKSDFRFEYRYLSED